MAWFGEGLSSLKGQLTNFTKEVLAEGRSEITDDLPQVSSLQRKIEELEALCASQELEVTRLKTQNDSFRTRLEEFQVPLPDQGGENGSTDSWWSVQHWQLPTTSNVDKTAHKGDEVSTQDLHHDELLRKQQLLDKEKERRISLELQIEKLNSEVKDAMTFKNKWQVAESRAKELEEELLKVQNQMLEQINCSQANMSELRGEVENTLQQLLHDANDKVEFLHNRQDLVNLIIQTSKKSREAELAVKKLQDDELQLTEDVTNIIQKLGDPEEQEIIHGALKALELENQVLKLRNAQLEDVYKGHTTVESQGSVDNSENMSDSFEMVLRNNEEHVLHLQSEWAEEKRTLEQNLFALYEKLENYEAKLSMLVKEKSYAEQELEAMTTVVQDLEVQLAGSRDECAALTSSLEELDLQHQDAINQLLAAKKCLQSECDQLLEKLKVADTKLAELITADTQKDDTDEMLESLMYDKVSNLLTFEISEEFYSRRDGDEGKGSQLVRALVKMCAECKWQRDTLERKVACLMKELRECREERDSLAELSQASGLPPIPENNEEVEALGQTVAVLEEKVAVLTESRSNLEADAERLREESRKLTNLLRASEESLGNERNIHTEVTAKLNACVSELQRKVESLEKNLQESDKERSAIQSTLKDARERLNEEIRVNSEIKLLLQECEVEKSTLQEELDKLSKLGDVGTLRQDYIDLQEKFNSSSFEYRECIENLKSLNSDVELELQIIKQQLSSVVEQLEESKRSCTDMNAIILEKEDEIRKLKELVESTQQDASDIKNKYDDLCSKHKSLEDDLSTNILIKTQTLMELEDIEGKLVGQRKVLDNLQENLTSKNKQCDDLMLAKAELDEKYVEIQQESSSLKAKVPLVEKELEEALKVKINLEEECKRLEELVKRLVGKEEQLQKEVASLTKDLDTCRQQLQEARLYSSKLELQLQEKEGQVSEQDGEVSNLKNAVVLANEHLEAEKQRRVQLEAEYSQCRQTLDQTSIEVSKLRDLYEGAVSELERTRHAVQEDRVDVRLHKEVAQQQEFVREQLHEVTRTKQHHGGVHGRGRDSNITDEKHDVGKDGNVEGYTAMGADMNKVRNEVESYVKNVDVSEAVLSSLRKILFELVSAKNNSELLLETKLHEIDLLKAKLIELEQDNMSLSESSKLQRDETSRMAKETISQLSEIIRDKDATLEVLAQKNESLVAQLETLKVEVSARNEEQSRLHCERDELIKAVRQKHEENVHYHAEIQRLSTLLNQELRKSEESRQHQKGLELQFEDKQKMLLNTQNELISVKQRLEKLEALAQNGESFQTVAAIQKTVGDLETELQRKEEIIKRNGEMLMSCENVIQAKEQELHHLRSQLVHIQAEVDKSSLHEQFMSENAKVAELESKLTSMSDVLQDERKKSRYLEHEAQELREKEGALRKELERLRQHLVGVEDSYTQEALRLEAQVQDLKQQVLSAEERIKNSSTAYTSVSIRANQQVETLQEQVRLITQQRDDIQQKLCSTEDQMERQTAALRNLQAVLKQFHKDKEREIMFETDRIRQQLQASHTKEAELNAEIKCLKGQLLEAKDGLCAAARLGEQLDRKTDLVAALKDEVNKLKQQLAETEQRVQIASQSSEGKVDKSLVKNLVLGYFVAPGKNRVDVLRVVATVLDFSEEERTRVGLAPGVASHNSPSLSEAFIKFLENESQPQPQLRLLPERKVSQSSEPSRGDNATPNRRTPLLLHDVQLPSFNQFPVGRNSSSILKDVLKDS